MKPRKLIRQAVKREKVSLRTFKPGSGKIVGGVDLTNVSPEVAKKVVSAYAKAAANVAPELGVRTARVPIGSTSGKAKVVQLSTRTSVSMSGISQEAWDRIFGKKGKNQRKKP